MLPWMFRILAVSLFLVAAADGERMARILYYGAPKDAPKKAFVHQGGKKVQEVVLERNNFSESFELGAGALRLMLLPSETLEEGPDAKAAPFLKIPENWNKVLIVVSEDSSNEVLPIRLQGINANKDQFGPGELLFVNLSERHVFGMVGEKKLQLASKGKTLISNPKKERGEYHVELDSIKGEDKKSRRWMLRQTWRHQPAVRRLIFVLPLPPPRNLKLYSAPIRNF